MPSPCPACKREFASSYARSSHMKLCAQPLTPMPPPKTLCPHHRWDEHGRPDPPAGRCSDRCWMIPGMAERES